MDFKFPDVGEGITEGKLIKWLVKVGDTIKVDQPLAEIETDKAVVQVPSPVNGVVSELLYKDEDTVIVGKPMMKIDTDEKPKKESTESQSKTKEEPKQETKTEPNEPEQKTQISEQSHNKINNKEILALPTVRKYARQNNIDLSMINGSGKDGRILMNDLNGNVNNKTSPREFKAETKTSKPLKDTFKPLKNILATPSTRQLARKLGVDLKQVKGTGNIGIITKEDVMHASKKESEAIKSDAPNEQPTFSSNEKEIVVPMTPIRQTIAKRMVESKRKAPHVTIFNEVNVSELYKIREKEKESYSEKGIKLTYLAFFTKAVVLALRHHPYLNSVLNDATNSIILKNYYNIGIAVDTDKGLFVPVIKDAHEKSIVEIAKEISDLAEKARNHKINHNDMSEGTFTITSIGNLAGEGFTPVINYPEAAILGIGRIQEKPVVKRRKIVPGKVVTFSLSFDHRILDGAEASRFMQTLTRYVENPDELFMEMI